MNQLLYGHNSDEKIVAVQHLSDSIVRIYFHSKTGVLTRDISFYPFFLLSDVSYLKGYAKKHWIRKLNGENYYCYLIVFKRWTDLWEAIHFIIDNYNKNSNKRVETYSELPFLYIKPDAVYQFLLQSGRTLFKEMAFNDLHRLQLKVIPYLKSKITTTLSSRLENRIVLIAMSDNRGWQQLISGRDLCEKELIEQFIKVINIKNPDVIEGHNIYEFDIQYLIQRSRLNDLEINIGRDGSQLKDPAFQSDYIYRLRDSTNIEVSGRHIIDTMLLAQNLDPLKKLFENYSLDYLAHYFNFSKADSINIKPERFAWYWDNEPDLLNYYAFEYLQQVRILSEFVSQVFFEQTKIFPFNFGVVTKLPSSTKIQAIFLREYLHKKHSLPKPDDGTHITVRYPGIFFTGIMGPIIQAEIESLYPSIMINACDNFKKDPLKVFKTAILSLIEKREEIKQKMNSEVESQEKIKLNLLQNSLKNLINSFFGYLTYNRGLFNDFHTATQVAKQGEYILNKIVKTIASNGGTIVDVDTDGIFIVPPSHYQTLDKEKQFIEMTNKSLLKGISLVIENRFKKMLIFKKKNYALLDYDNRIQIKGFSIISRTMERFSRNFIRQCIESILNNNIKTLNDLYNNLHRDISERKLSIYDLMRTETLKEDIEEYLRDTQTGKRNRSACYEAALNSGYHWKVGDLISYYITGNDPNVTEFDHCKLAEEWDPNFPDENIQYYLKRLDEMADKFRIFFSPQDFKLIFTRNDLFGFSKENINILTLPVSPEIAHNEL